MSQKVMIFETQFLKVVTLTVITCLQHFQKKTFSKCVSEIMFAQHILRIFHFEKKQYCWGAKRTSYCSRLAMGHLRTWSAFGPLLILFFYLMIFHLFFSLSFTFLLCASTCSANVDVKAAFLCKKKLDSHERNIL